MSNTQTINTINVSAIEVYKLVLSNKLKSFPRYFWDKPNSLNSAIEIMHYLIEKILKWSEEDVKENFCSNTLKSNALGGMLKRVFDSNLFLALDSAYPNKYCPWELKNSSVSNGYWSKETTTKATKWLIETKLNWTEDDVKNNLCTNTFVKNGLSGMLMGIFQGSYYLAINSAYPNKYKPWEFNQVSNKYWNNKTGIEATKWLIETKLKWSVDDVKEKLTGKVFVDSGLGGMLNVVYNNSPYNAINDAYPNKYKPWELNRTSANFWNKDTAKKAVDWLFNEFLKWDIKDIENKISVNIFEKYGLISIYHHIYGSDLYKMMTDLYPHGDWSKISKLTLKNKTCVICGRQFETNRSNKKTCCKKCSHKLKMKRSTKYYYQHKDEKKKCS